ncbi:MAG: CoA pyrophosphatase, partial [Gammaproteobacteria bacterium]
MSEPEALQVPATFDPQASPVVAEAVPPFAAVAQEHLEPGWLRERFTHPPSWSPESTGDRIRLYEGPPRAAAVLIPIVAHRDAPTVLLTQRTLHLRQHSGQVAFPGGRTEQADPTPVFTALRETREEIGLDPARVEVIDGLPEYLTGTGFRITPVVGLVDPGCTMHADPHEVAAIFEVPLDFLMDPRHHQR